MDGLRTVIAGADLSFRKKLKEKLMMAGILVVGEASDGWNALRMVLNIQPDLVILHARLSGRDGLEVAKFVEEHRIAPVILYADAEKLSAIREMLGHWVVTYLLEPVEEQSLLPAIDFSLAVHRRITAMEEQNKKLLQTLETRKLVDRAKGLLIAEKGMSEQQAFRYLQKLSMDKCLPVEKVAGKVIKLLQAK
ncbi:MAG TPA: ANTAR domain-containing protein [Bacillota bacterium]|nr:ANTAR domain-containing protein [Bacillota bacterium]